MTPEQFSLFLESNERATAAAIQKFVNGKIDYLTGEVARNHQSLMEHSRDDKIWQEKLEPMLKVFDDNTIVKMKLKKTTGTIVFYTSSFTVIGAAVMWIFKTLFGK